MRCTVGKRSLIGSLILGLALAACATACTGCAALQGMLTPDPKPVANLHHVERLVQKDPDPADAVVNTEALQTAQALAAGSTDGVSGTLTAIGTAAGATGTPWGGMLQLACAGGVAILGYLHNKNAKKINVVTDTVDEHAKKLGAAGPTAGSGSASAPAPLAVKS